ncbi:MAG: hypothetical protein AAF125_24990 [Chloroflexota bacterium]
MALSEFQTLKMTKLFQFWDINNTETLEQSDYLEIIDRVLAERGWQQDSPEYDSIYTVIMTNWAQIEHFADKDNGGVTLSDWLAYCDHVVNDATAYRVNAMEVMSALLGAVDTDSDGQLTLDDFKMWFRIFKASDTQAKTAFARLDTDRSGELSISEIIDALDDFYHSNAVSVAGNHLFGELPS